MGQIFFPAGISVGPTHKTLLRLTATAVLFCWVTHGRDLLPPAALLSVVPNVLGKLGLYGRFLVRKRASRWIRTDRG